jgi:uncharacterized phage-associated protein
MKNLNLQPIDVARHFLSRAADDGDLVTNLKMQKLVYYAYSWVLTINKTRLFDESLEAWANGPVAPSLYRSLSKYGYNPIPKSFVDPKSLQKVSELTKPVLYTLNAVYDSYIPMAAFELVTLSHSESPWRKARGNLGDTEQSNNKIEDDDIIEYFSKL